MSLRSTDLQIIREMHQKVSRSDIRETVNVSWSLLHYSLLSSFMEICHHMLKDLKEVVSEVCEKHRSHRAASCDLLIKGALYSFGLVSNEIVRGCHICQI